MNVLFDENCLACKTNAGIVKPPGGAILMTDSWRLEHALLPAVAGRLILKASSHREGDSTRSMSLEGADIRWLAICAIKAVVRPVRVYEASFCEDVAHAHYHLLPRMEYMSSVGGGDGAGIRIFEAMNRRSDWHASSETIEETVEAIRAHIEKMTR